LPSGGAAELTIQDHFPPFSTKSIQTKMGTSIDLSSLSIWLRDFYNKSDDPTDPAGYANFFVEDGTLIFGHAKFKGRQGTQSNSKLF